MSIYNPPGLTATNAAGTQTVTLAGCTPSAIAPGMVLHIGSRGSKQGVGYVILTVTATGATTATLVVQDVIPGASTNVPCLIDTQGFAGDPAILTASNTYTILNQLQVLFGLGTGITANDRQIVLDKANAGAINRVAFREASVDYFFLEQRLVGGIENLVLGSSPDGSTKKDSLRIDRATGRPTFPSGGLLEHGQCRLVKVGNNAVLQPHNGNRLLINGVVCTIPSGGLTLTTSGLTANLNYYIYANDANGDGVVDGLEASSTTHAPDAATGVEVMSGNASRTLVGMVRTTAATAFADTVTQRFLASWFNRQRKPFAGVGTAGAQTTSTSFIELSSAARVEFLTWADEPAMLILNGVVQNNTAAAVSASQIGVDGATPILPQQLINQNNTNYFSNAAASTFYGLSEGYHFATPLGKVDSNTGTFYLNIAGGVFS